MVSSANSTPAFSEIRARRLTTRPRSVTRELSRIVMLMLETWPVWLPEFVREAVIRIPDSWDLREELVLR